MAWETGTATNQADLLAKIVTFLTTNADLITDGQEWTDLGTAAGQTTGKWLQGPGMAGTDQIFVGLQAVNDIPGDIYGIQVAGAQAFNAGQGFNAQVGQSPTSYVAVWNSSMPYWIVGNGQRFVVVVKVSTTYHAMYCGKILPYGTPTQYGYPLFIGGENITNLRWSDTTVGNRQFIDPGSASSGVNSGSNLCFPDGAWQFFQNFYNVSGNDTLGTQGRSIWPYAGSSNNGTEVDNRLREMRDNIDGTYTLLPLILHSEAPSRQVFGELDGCFYVSGFNNAAENIITIDAVDYLVVQNIFRTNRWNYWALKLA
jgi:hypothetical protein